MKALLLVFLGGGTGSVARYLISRLGNTTGAMLPFGTLAVNVIGSFLIGLILGWAVRNNAFNTNTSLLLATGFCGGFTTFSAFAYENHTFLKSGDITSFALYTILSIVLGLIGVFVGLWVAKIA